MSTKRQNKKAPPPIQVSTVEVKTGNAIYYDEYPATVVALNQVDLRPEVSGYITEIFIQDGQHVAKGMRLYAIDQQQYQAAYDQVRGKSECGQSRTSPKRSRMPTDTLIWRRMMPLHGRRLNMQSTTSNPSKMQVAAAEASVKSAETNLRYSVIQAPFDGTIGISLVKLGSAVTTGQTMLNTISSDDPIAVDCAVDEKQISRFNALLQSSTEWERHYVHDRSPGSVSVPVSGQAEFPRSIG